MTLALPPRAKSAAQAIVPALSFVLVHGRSDKWWTALRAFVGALQGFGAGSTVQQEALCASRFIDRSVSTPIIIDAGANVGEWSVALSRLLDRKPAIYMFEPLAAARDMLQSKIPDGEILPVAIGDEIEERDLFLSHELDSTASLHYRKDSVVAGRSYRPERVKVITLDSFISARGIQRVDFLKMDLEGNELAALNGAQHALRTKVLRAMSFEFGSSNLNSRTFFRDLWELLTHNSYKLERMLPTGSLLPVTEYNEELEFFGRTTTYFASVKQ